jgi:hypothetical protein
MRVRNTALLTEDIPEDLADKADFLEVSFLLVF